MARKMKPRSSPAPRNATAGIAIAQQNARPAPGFTGRYLVSMHKDGVSDGVKLLRTKAGLNIAATSDFGGGVIKAAGGGGANAFMLEHLGIAVIEAPQDQLGIIKAAAAERGPVRQMTRERYVHVAARTDMGGSISDYVAGYRDG